MAGSHQKFDQAACPSLLEFLEKIGQFPQVMGIAQPVLAQQIAVRFPAVVDQCAQKAGRIPSASKASLPRFS